MTNILKKPFILIALLVIFPTIILILIFSRSPLFSLFSFFTGPFSSLNSFNTMINRTSPLILTSLGAFIALKSNSINLGGDGQVYVGATVTAILLPSIESSSITLPVVILIALSIAGLLTYISAILSDKYGVSSLISTYLFAMIAAHICNYLISGPFLLKGSNILRTAAIPIQYNLSYSIIPSLIVTIIISVILKYSLFGYEFRISGKNTIFAEGAGIKSHKYRVFGLTFSGILHGAAGVILVIGTHHHAIVGFHNGLGWNGLSSALLAGDAPILVIFSSLLYAYLDSGATYASIISDITLELSTIIKGTLFFVISSKFIKEQFLVKDTK